MTNDNNTTDREEFIALRRAVDEMIEACHDMFFDNATAFTCDEINSLVTLYDLAGHGTPDDLIAEHAEGDDEGDEHYLDQRPDDPTKFTMHNGRVITIVPDVR